jgi:hypothetical protein
MSGGSISYHLSLTVQAAQNDRLRELLVFDS